MIQLLIPRNDIALTAQVQQVLLLAKHHGFDIDDIYLGASPTLYCQLVTPSYSSLIGSDCLASCEDALSVLTDKPNLFLQYQVNFCAQMPFEHSQKRETCLVKIGLTAADSHDYVDEWYHGEELRRIRYSTNAHAADAKSEHFAWVLSLLCLDFLLEDALVVARAAMSVSRETWPTDSRYFPQLQHSVAGIFADDKQNHICFPKIDKNIGLYPVVDSAEWAERLLKFGVKTIQLRIKDSTHPDLESQIIAAIELGKAYQAQVFINDHWQLAIKHGAFGVHLGQEDLTNADLAQIAQAGICLGISTHGYYEILNIASLNPSYIALGHIFPTTTKIMPSKPQGLVRLKLYQQLIESLSCAANSDEVVSAKIPTVAIGGINLENALQVWQCDVLGLAVVRAVTEAKSPQLVIDSFNRIIQNRLPSSAEEVCDYAF
ncbi:thiamine phosphate synthase [Vibrio sp. ZOR0018]|uniref:thiamine phosphate synthase n=1 Tax=Vibrio sp. ZOR0018 TaxID=1339225 RepID=UPI000648938A|nr:thiamine phosphate synthase [Vibrio sp. ZOR0018]